MNWRMLAAVLFVFACAYGILAGVRYGQSQAGFAAAAVIDGIEACGQPWFPVERGTRTLPYRLDGSLRVENPAGSVKVVVDGPATVAEYVISARGETEAEARRRAAAVEVEAVATEDGGEAIRVKAHGRTPAGVAVELVVHAPPERTLFVRTVSASIEVDGMRGDVAAESVSGEINVGSAARSVRARSVSGEIGVVGARGKTEARSTSGSISLGDLSGEEIAARTVSGSIEIAVSKPFAGRLEAKSVSGEVSVSLPRSSDMEASASSLSGAISGESWHGSTGRTSHSRLGSGRGAVALSTVSGGINLLLTN